MASSFSTASSTWPQRMCACGYDHCFVKVSRSHKNPGCAYYVCPRPVQCVNWIGWCAESGTRIPDHDSRSTDVMQLRADVVNIFNTLRVMKIDAILAGRRVGTTITKTGYNEIALKFTKRTGRRHDITQLKNKYGSLKKEWQAWNKLMDISKGVTGIGFDRDTGLFMASEEWWDNLKSTNKIAYKFKMKPLEHKDLMRAVFTGATATGKHHWTPGEKPVDVGEGESDSVDSLGTSGKLKKVSSGASVLADSFNHLSKAVETQQHLTVRHGTGASQKYGIEPYMQRLMAISDFISTPMFHFACIALENADYREILMCMPDDENVVGWLAQLQVSKGL
ncbi:hypothetical protein ACSBR2_033495 [Camellia fascicularis]